VDRCLTFPLHARRRVAGVPFGATRSRRRGVGSDIAATRAYRPGDDTRRIDWFASARLSAATERDEFVVRDHHADETASVAIVADRGPTMALFPRELPWLRKWEARDEAERLIAASAAHARAPLHRAGADSVARALLELERRRSLGVGSFVFVLSDFAQPVDGKTLRRAAARGWEVVPVLIQDPCWEQSFPAVGGAVLPVQDASGGALRLVRLRRAEAEARREENEHRYAALVAGFRALGTEPVPVSSHVPEEILRAFLRWSGTRVDCRRPAA